jgi:sulfate permease, SulP family
MKTSFPFRPRVLELFGSNRLRFSLGEELLAGATVGLIALPLAIALGIASIPDGLSTPLAPPALGIAAAIVGGLAISLLGGSRVQIGGPTAAFIPIVLLIASRHGYSGLLLATMMAGAILVLMGLTRMGMLIKYIPWPVTSGFTTGIAVAIILGQIPDLAGIQAAGTPSHEFAARMAWLVRHAPNANPYALGLGLACIAAILLWPRLGLRRIPGSIVAMVGALAFISLAGWDASRGVATLGSKFGPDAIPPTLPWPSLPAWNWTLVHDLVGPALAIAILGAIESLLSAVVADGLSGDRHDSNTELIAQGVANLVCPIFGGLPVTGAIARTSANVNNGGKTPVAGVVHALTLLLVVLVGARWAALVPMPAMSAILVVVALRMGQWNVLRRVRTMPRSDALVLCATFALTVVFDLVVAVEVGMVLAAILFVKRVSDTTEVSRVTREDMLERPEHVAQGKDIPDGVVVYRIFGPFLFGAAEKMQQALEGLGEPPRILVLRMHLVTAMDATGMNALQSIVERLRKRRGQVVISGIHRQPFQMLLKAGFIDQIGKPNLCATFDEALARSRAILEAPAEAPSQT